MPTYSSFLSAVVLYIYCKFATFSLLNSLQFVVLPPSRLFPMTPFDNVVSVARLTCNCFCRSLYAKVLPAREVSKGEWTIAPLVVL